MRTKRSVPSFHNTSTFKPEPVVCPPTATPTQPTQQSPMLPTRLLPAAALLAFAALAASTQPAAKPAGPTVAIINERLLTWPDIAPLLAEASGGQVLEELALSLILKEETAKRSIRIGTTEIAAERALLGQMLASAARLPDSESEQLITAARRTRGLGDARFKSLLERNAALRAMVRAGVGDTAVTITPEDIDTAYELKHGPRISARLILVRSQAAATQAAQRLAAGTPFSEVAADLSVDPSSQRGGRLEPFSLSDPAYPVAVRRVLQSLAPNIPSDPISVTWGGGASTLGAAGAPADNTDSGFAIILKDATIDPPRNSPTRDAAAKDLEREIRTVRERAQMDKLARQLLRNNTITPMDPGLNWSWEQRQK